MEASRILNSRGEPIILNSREQRVADYNQRICNALGFEINVTTLTTIGKKISEQKFFDVLPADYLPVRVGEGAYSMALTTFRSFNTGGEFEDGIIDTGGQNSRLASADAGLDALTIKVFPWAKEIAWTIHEMEYASRNNNWDLVTAKEQSRKKNWDLGIQRIAFIGARGNNGVNGACVGLLNQPGVTVNPLTSTGAGSGLTQSISSMSPAQLKAMQANLIETYRNNNNRTAYPTHFVIPESDYNGLASQASADFPMRTTLSLLEEAFQLITRKKDFKILPLPYADASYHADVASIAGKQVYTLLNYDEQSVRMDIPLDYQNTLANTVNNFQYQNVGHGQFTGVLAYRPLEMTYYTF